MWSKGQGGEGGLARTWGRRLDGAELLQHPQPVEGRPTIKAFAVAVITENIDPFHAEPFARRWHEGFQMVEVRPAVRAGHRITCYGLVPFGELILDGNPEVRERSSDRRDKPLHALPTGWGAGGQKM